MAGRGAAPWSPPRLRGYAARGGYAAPVLATVPPHSLGALSVRVRVIPPVVPRAPISPPCSW